MIVKKPEAEKRLGKKLKGRARDWYALSHTGKKKLGGPYSRKRDAKERLRQVEAFKHMKKRNPPAYVPREFEYEYKGYTISGHEQGPFHPGGSPFVGWAVSDPDGKVIETGNSLFERDARDDAEEAVNKIVDPDIVAQKYESQIRKLVSRTIKRGKTDRSEIARVVEEDAKRGWQKAREWFHSIPLQDRLDLIDDQMRQEGLLPTEDTGYIIRNPSKGKSFRYKGYDIEMWYMDVPIGFQDPMYGMPGWEFTIKDAQDGTTLMGPGSTDYPALPDLPGGVPQRFGEREAERLAKEVIHNWPSDYAMRHRAQHWAKYHNLIEELIDKALGKGMTTRGDVARHIEEERKYARYRDAVTWFDALSIDERLDMIDAKLPKEGELGYARNPAAPINKALYERVKREAKKKFDVWPSVYASSWVVREYKKRGGRYREENPLEGLEKWYAEEWVDLGRSIDSKGRVKKWVKCGRPTAAEGKYPKCVPLAKAKKMTPKQRLSAVKRKRAMEKVSPKGKGRPPTMVKTFTNPKRKELYIKPNQAAVKAAKRGLEARKKAPKSKKGGLSALQAKEEGVGSGVMRARDIIAGKKVNAYQVKAFFDRHRGNYLKAKTKGLKPEESRAIQAWLIWGGEPLRKQAEKAVEKDRKKNPLEQYGGYDFRIFKNKKGSWTYDILDSKGDILVGPDYGWRTEEDARSEAKSAIRHLETDEPKRERYRRTIRGLINDAIDARGAKTRAQAARYIEEQRGTAYGPAISWFNALPVKDRIEFIDEHLQSKGLLKEKPDLYAIRANPKKKFLERDHDWNEVLIQTRKKKLTRKQIRDYYKKNQRKIWPFLKGQTVLVYLAPRKNKFVLRRKDDKGKYIKLTKLKGIDDPHSYEYWIHRRVIEFHPVLTKKTTPIIWVDMDMHTTKNKATRKKLFRKMKSIVPKVKKIFKKLGVERSYIYSSGEDGGIHVEGQLSRPKNVDKMRKGLTAMLKAEFEDDEMITTGIAKSGQIRLDTTTLHELGSLRAPWSFTKTGDVKKRIKE